MSLGFARNRDIFERIQRDCLSRIRMHPMDEESLEVEIARTTLKIRNAQMVFAMQEASRKPGRLQQSRMHYQVCSVTATKFRRVEQHKDLEKIKHFNIA